MDKIQVLFYCCIYYYFCIMEKRQFSPDERLAYCLDEDREVAQAALSGLLIRVMQQGEVTFERVLEQWLKRCAVCRETPGQLAAMFVRQFEALPVRELSPQFLSQVAAEIRKRQQIVDVSGKIFETDEKVLTPFDLRQLERFYFRLAFRVYCVAGDEKTPFKFSLAEWLDERLGLESGVCLLDELMPDGIRFPEFWDRAFAAFSARGYVLDADLLARAAVAFVNMGGALSKLPGYALYFQKVYGRKTFFQERIWFACLKIEKACVAAGGEKSSDTGLCRQQIEKYLEAADFALCGRQLLDVVRQTAEMYSVSAACRLVFHLSGVLKDVGLKLALLRCLLEIVPVENLPKEKILALLAGLQKEARASGVLPLLGDCYEVLVEKVCGVRKGLALIEKVREGLAVGVGSGREVLEMIAFRLAYEPAGLRERLVEFAVILLEIIKKPQKKGELLLAKTLIGQLVLSEKWHGATTDVPAEMFVRALLRTVNVKCWEALTAPLIELVLTEQIYPIGILSEECQEAGRVSGITESAAASCLKRLTDGQKRQSLRQADIQKRQRLIEALCR